MTVKVTVAKAFSYAHNGVDAVQLAEGDEHVVHKHLFPGLKAAGLVEASSKSEAARQPEQSKEPKEPKEPKTPKDPAPKA